MKAIDRYRAYVRGFKIFQGMEPETVWEVLKHGNTVEFFRRTAVFYEGQRGNHLFIVLDGKIGIYHKDHLIAICRAGDAFGEMSVLDHEPHGASAVALTDVHLLTLDEFQLQRFIDGRHSVTFLLNIIHDLCRHLRHTNTEGAQLRKQLIELTSQTMKQAKGAAQ